MEIGPAEQVIKSPAQPVHRGPRVRVADARPADDGDAGRSGRSSSARRRTPRAIPSGCRFHPRCPLAFDRCRVEEPPLFDVGGGQSAACWLAEGGRSLPVMPTPPASRPRRRRPAAAGAERRQRRRPARDRPTAEPTRRRLPALPPATIADLLDASALDGRRPSSRRSATRAAGGRRRASGARTSASVTHRGGAPRASPAGSGTILGGATVPTSRPTSRTGTSRGRRGPPG